MIYDLEWLKNFDGKMLPSQVDMAELANSIEVYVSQFRYVYTTSLADYPSINIEVRNGNIPHLLGLSKTHHFSLPSSDPLEIFAGIKSDWTLAKLIKSDEKWFQNNQDKLIGVLLLYQLLHVQECQAYTPMYIIGKPMGKRFKRDDIFFVILKLASGKAYTIELSPIKGQNDTFFPRSIKINDDKVLNCTKFTVVFDHQERLRAKKRYTKGIPWPIDD